MWPFAALVAAAGLVMLGYALLSEPGWLNGLALTVCGAAPTGPHAVLLAGRAAGAGLGPRPRAADGLGAVAGADDLERGRRDRGGHRAGLGRALAAGPARLRDHRLLARPRPLPGAAERHPAQAGRGDQRLLRHRDPGRRRWRPFHGALALRDPGLHPGHRPHGRRDGRGQPGSRRVRRPRLADQRHRAAQRRAGDRRDRLAARLGPRPEPRRPGAAGDPARDGLAPRLGDARPLRAPV